jgi:pimeloyl-ACP methyl ester carboxylesterase
MPETKTIFMIHGMWGGAWVWENYCKFFEQKGYRCVSTTLPFHDVPPEERPDPRLGATSLLDYADALEGEIRRLDAQPIVMGHSMGGLLSQMLGSRGLAKALVLLTPAAPSGILSIKPSVLWSFRSVLLRWGFWREPARQTFDEAVYSMLHVLPVEERKSLYDKFVYESGRAAFEIGFWLLDSRRATRIDASTVTCPVLVVGGGQDRITPASVVRNVALKYGAAYKEFPDHAHWVLGEPGWQDVARFVGEWLADNVKG